jgi:hypothetical protein
MNDFLQLMLSYKKNRIKIAAMLSDGKNLQPVKIQCHNPFAAFQIEFNNVIYRANLLDFFKLRMARTKQPKEHIFIFETPQLMEKFSQNLTNKTRIMLSKLIFMGDVDTAKLTDQNQIEKKFKLFDQFRQKLDSLHIDYGGLPVFRLVFDQTHAYHEFLNFFKTNKHLMQQQTDSTFLIVFDIYNHKNHTNEICKCFKKILWVLSDSKYNFSYVLIYDIDRDNSPYIELKSKYIPGPDVYHRPIIGVYNFWQLITYGLSKQPNLNNMWHNFLTKDLYDPRLLCYISTFYDKELGNF